MRDSLDDFYYRYWDILVDSIMKEPNQKVKKYLKILHENTKIWKFSPSDLYEAAHSVLVIKDSNPDWLAQSANSLREITYLIRTQKESPEKKVLVKQAFEAFVSEVVDETLASEILFLEDLFSKLAHHNSLKSLIKKLSNKGIDLSPGGKLNENEYEKILKLADVIFLRALPLQVNTHREIEKVVSHIPSESLLSKVKYLVDFNDDTRDFFFSVVPDYWITWLHNNGFFAILNKPAENPNRYSFRMPELSYLERVVAQKPNEVTAIMLEVDLVAHYNPEVVDRFTRISESLSGDNLTKIIKKIHSENWVRLMKRFNTWSYAYADIVKKLVQENNINSLILLADVVMTVRQDREEIRSNPFELNYMSDISLLEALVAVDGEDVEKVYQFLIKKLSEVIGDGVKDDAENRVFKIEEPYYFFDVDLFTHDFDDSRSHSYRDDIENFMAAIVLVTRKLFSEGCGKERKLRAIYKYLDDNLPDSWSGWRLRLFTASFCGDLFRVQLESMFNRLFSVMEEGKSYYEIESGAEYRKALKATWLELGHEFKQEYIKNIFKYFDPAKETDKDLAGYHARDAVKILKMIEGDVDDAAVKQVFGYSLTDKRIPEPIPAISRGYAGTVVDRSPIAIADKSVAELPDLLKGVLRPEEIEAKYKNDPFHNPRSVEGVGSELREDVEKRFDEYLELIDEFFAPGEIETHYTYSILVGVENVLRSHKSFSEDKWKKLFDVIERIQVENVQDIEDENKRSFLVGWRSVRRTNADILKYSLNKDFLSDKVFSENRVRILKVINSLLYSGDPKPEYEEGKYGDFVNIAINHTMGVAYQAYIQLLYRDGDVFKSDTEQVFKELIEKNTTLSTWSMVGQYLPSVYYRNREFVEALLPKIFTKDNREQFFAAWEGYVISSVYHELFEVMQDYYLYALLTPGDRYPERGERRRDFDQAIGVHLSLAYTHFEEVTLEHNLIKTLWEKADEKKQGEFISHIGRGFISSNSIKLDSVQIEKVLQLWDWLLGKAEGEISPEVYGEFGLWVRDKSDDDIVSLEDIARRFAKILNLSKGRLDYEYHLKDKLPDLAKVDPDSVLSIMRSLLLGDDGENSRNLWLRSDAASTEVFTILFNARSKETETLINDLIEKKGRVFWGLKTILK